MSDDRLDQCRERLEVMQRSGESSMTDGGGELPLEARADALEFVHRSLVAELDDLLDGDRSS